MIGREKFEQNEHAISNFVFLNTTIELDEAHYVVQKFSEMFDPTLNDLMAFINFGKDNKWEFDRIMSVVAHDLNLIYDAFPDTCLPRSYGYANRMVKNETQQ